MQGFIHSVRISRRRLLVVLTGTVSTALLASCAQPAPGIPTPPAAVQPQQPSPTQPPLVSAPTATSVVQSQPPAATISGAISYATDGGEPERVLYTETINAFMAKYPNIKVELQVNGSQHYEKLDSGFAAGAAPEVILISSRNLLPYASKKVLENLDPIIRTHNIRINDYYELAQSEFQGGELNVPKANWGLLQGWGAAVMGVNLDLIEQIGIKLEPDFDNTWTLDDFRSIASKLVKSTSGGIEAFGGSYPEQWALIWAFGGEVLNADKTRCTLNTPQVIQAYTWLLQNIEAKIEPTAADNQAAGPGGLWLQGRLGFQANAAPFILAQLSTYKFKYDILKRPAGPGGSWARLYTDGYVLWSEVKDNKAAATEFLVWMAGKDGQSTLQKGGGRGIPGLKAVAESPLFLDPSKPLPRRKVWLESVDRLKRQPLVPEWNEMTKIFNDAWNAMLRGELTPADCAATQERGINQLFSQRSG